MTEVQDLLIERPDRLVLCRFDELVNRPPSPWQIRGVLREQSVSQLYGKRGCYKSFLALDLAACLATGLPWQGFEVVSPGLVIYIAGEGGGGMVQRARAWAEQHQFDPAEVNILFITEPVLVTSTSDDMEIVIQRIRTAINWHPGGEVDSETGYFSEHDTASEWPVLIVIDTLARCFTGDENKQEDMGIFIQGVDRLKQEFNTSILILHHTGWDDRHERGSTAFGGACDIIYRLDADTESKQLTLTNEKMKDSREPEPIILAYKEVEVTRRPQDDPNEDLTSVVIETVGAGKEEKTAHLLHLLTEHGPLSYSDLFELSGLKKTAFKDYLSGLRKSGKILNENGIYLMSRAG